MRQPRSTARHRAARRKGTGARRAALTSLGAGLAVAAAAPMASAATTNETPAPLSAAMLTDATVSNFARSAFPGTEGASATQKAMHAAFSRLGGVRLYPMAGTGIDPLSNVVGTNLSGVPISTRPLTDMVSDGLPMTDLPVAGALFQAAQGLGPAT